jgi:hypothetical protein
MQFILVVIGGMQNNVHTVGCVLPYQQREVCRCAYKRARVVASRETGINRKGFPQVCPFKPSCTKHHVQNHDVSSAPHLATFADGALWYSGSPL